MNCKEIRRQNIAKLDEWVGHCGGSERKLSRLTKIPRATIRRTFKCEEGKDIYERFRKIEYENKFETVRKEMTERIEKFLPLCEGSMTKLAELMKENYERLRTYFRYHGNKEMKKKFYAMKRKIEREREMKLRKNLAELVIKHSGSTKCIAEELGLSESHVSKIINTHKRKEIGVLSKEKRTEAKNKREQERIDAMDIFEKIKRGIVKERPFTGEPVKFEKREDFKNFIVTKAKSSNNIYLPSDFISNLYEQFDSRMVKQYIEGEFVNIDSELVYYCFDRAENVISSDLLTNKISGEKRSRIILSFDFNVNPMCAVEIITEGKTRYQVQEYKVPNSNTRELCENIIERMQQRYENWRGLSVIITGDASGQSRSSSGDASDYFIIKSMFDKAGFESYLFVKGANPPVRERVNFVNALLEKKQFYISDACVHSIKDRELVNWKKGSEKFIIDKSDRESTHLSDACDYGLWATRYTIESDENMQYSYVVNPRRNYV
ncbi:MAG: hypothetical protein JST55_14605 [Bacteroidetes bacterium]|nr:hypothetical protein [Bacteroidota bacterium]